MQEVKTISKREASARRYIDELLEQNSKLNIIRVDLAYKKPYSNDIGFVDASKDLEKMLNNMRSKPSIWRDKLGYVIKKEFTVDKGMHIHAIFIFNGQKVKSDVYKAEQIGMYWNNEITKDKGTYHNCNRNEYEENGIGILNYKDIDKRKILDERVISYLCKDEQNISDIDGVEGVAGKGIAGLKALNRNKSFLRGSIPRFKAVKAGRPRE